MKKTSLFHGNTLGLEETLPASEEKSSPKNRIEALRRDLEAHNHRYYVENAPTISDQAFDLLLKELEALEKQYPEFDDPNSPTHRVGGEVSSAFRSFSHRRPMLSLSNTYTFEEVEDFYLRCAKITGNKSIDMVSELKFDGLSIALTYENGILKQALTRGDGLVGDDVTANIRTINSIPLRLHQGGYPFPHYLEVRGEVLLPYAEFDRLNLERSDAGDPLFSNPRNAAAGSLKLLDTAEVRHRRLDAFLYYAWSDEILPDSHFERLELLRQWGFKVSAAGTLCHSLEDVRLFIEDWEKKRHTLPFATDGVVLKIDKISLQERLGATAKAPRWAIAFKFETERSSSLLQKVSFQVGRTGVVTPVANFSPVQISGSTVRRATLHNADFLETLDLRLGDTVFVEKGGEVIPKVVGVDLDKRPSDAEKVTFIDHCPDCGTPLVRKPGEVAIYCPNRLHCPTQAKETLLHYCGRKAADINLGDETIEALYSKDFVRTIPDLYSLTKEQLSQLNGFKDRAISKLLKSIDDSKKRPFAAILFGIGIPFVGEGTAKLLVAHYPSIEALGSASLEGLCDIDGIGEKTAKEVVDFFLDEDNVRLLSRLKEAGVQLWNDTSSLKQENHGILMGKSIVISGTFTHHSREEYETMILQHGGKRSTSISKNTSFVLAGEAMGPSKREKAEKLGISLVSEDEFLRMLND